MDTTAIKRRQFAARGALGLLALPALLKKGRPLVASFSAGLGLVGSTHAGAQAALQEGQQFETLQTPAKVSLPTPQKKIEVVEFFWYGCPHCFAFEPILQSWSRQLPPDVHFHQIPFAFIGPVEHQKLFYALDDIGVREAVQPRLFSAIHVDKKPLNTDAEILAFVSANGVDASKFSAAYKSFGVNTRVMAGKALSSAYKIDSVPMIGVQGRYTTSPAAAGSHEATVAVVNQLIQRVRQTG